MSILVVEPDVLVRYPLAEYLRECGYRVLEAVNNEEAKRVLRDGGQAIDIVLVDLQTEGRDGFALSTWVRQVCPDVDVILAGTVAAATEKAGNLCNDGPKQSTPYSHRLLLDRIRRLSAARERASGA